MVFLRRLRFAAQFEAEADVLAHGAPGKQAELLEYHGDALASYAAHLRGVAGGNIDGGFAGTHQDVAAGKRDSSRWPPAAGWTCRAGQSHQHRNLAARHAQGGAGHADDDPEFALDVGPGAPGIEGCQGLADGPAAVAPPLLGEENIDVPEIRPAAVIASLPALWGLLIRSRMMASSTMVNPASNPIPTCTEPNARTTGTPSPPAPTKAAITTMERLSMMHCGYAGNDGSCGARQLNFP